MDLNEFTFKVRESIGDYLSAYDIEDISEREIIKNNGVKYTGIVITARGKDAAPTVYMDYYYGLYKRGKDFDEVMKMIYKNYLVSAEKLELIEKKAGNLSDYKERLYIKVINYEKNKARLEKCPYIPFLDLAITFRYLVHRDNSEISSAIVQNALLECWGLDIRTVYKIAFENTKKIFPPIVRRMSDILKANAPANIYIPENDMYIITNESGINGATYIMNKELFDDLCIKEKEGFYIIPSSVHEIILIPRRLGEDEDVLKMFIKGVNETAVPRTDFLSDNLYYYNPVDGIKII